MSELKFPDPHWAVFNLHVNDAGERALSICRKLYGALPEDANEDEKRRYARNGMPTLERDYKDGVMRIFEDSPMKPAAKTFAELCFVFANGLDRVRE